MAAKLPARGQARIIYDVRSDEVSKEDPVTRPEQPPLGSAIGLAQEIADHFAKVYERTADVLENSAAIAERIAERQERSGRSEAAKDERRAAAWARQAAQRARSLAGERCTPTGGRNNAGEQYSCSP